MRYLKRRPPILVNCDNCGIHFLKHQCHIADHNFCSRRCHLAWHHTNRPWDESSRRKKVGAGNKKAYAEGRRKPINPKGSKLNEIIRSKMRGRVPWNKGLGIDRSPRYPGTGRTGPRPLAWRLRIGQAVKRAYREGRLVPGISVRPNKVEMLLDSILQEYFPGEWAYVGDGKFIIETLNPDFINCNGKKEIIEVFGDYWHGPKRKRPFSSESERAEVYATYGYRLLVIWEHELKKISPERMVKKIKKWRKNENEGKIKSLAMDA